MSRPGSYEEFATSYNATVQLGVQAWNAGRMDHLDRVEAALRRADEQKPNLVARVALLGPGIGSVAVPLPEGVVA